MIGRTLFVETFVQIWVLLDLSRMDVALTHYLLWVKSWQYNWLDRPLLFRHLAFRRGKALKKYSDDKVKNSCPSKEWKKRRRYFCAETETNVLSSGVATMSIEQTNVIWQCTYLFVFFSFSVDWNMWVAQWPRQNVGYQERPSHP